MEITVVLKKNGRLESIRNLLLLEVTSSLSHPSPFQVVGLIPECQTFEIPYEAMPREMLSLNISKSIFHRFSSCPMIAQRYSTFPSLPFQSREKNLIRMKSFSRILNIFFDLSSRIARVRKSRKKKKYIFIPYRESFIFISTVIDHRWKSEKADIQSRFSKPIIPLERM